MKMQRLNDLLTRGYNICFLLDRIVTDYLTTAEFEYFYQEVIQKFPNPDDTTGTFDEAVPEPPKPKRDKPCRILHLTSKQS